MEVSCAFFMSVLDNTFATASANGDSGAPRIRLSLILLVSSVDKSSVFTPLWEMSPLGWRLFFPQYYCQVCRVWLLWWLRWRRFSYLVSYLNVLWEGKLAIRCALKGPMGNLPAFRIQLQALLENEESREQLLREIGLVSGKQLSPFH